MEEWYNGLRAAGLLISIPLDIVTAPFQILALIGLGSAEGS